jgi:hypothetical protein
MDPHALTIIGRAVRDWLRHIVLLTLASSAWVVLSLTVILLPPATAGLYMVTNRLAYGQRPRVADFLAGMHDYAWISVRWGILNGFAILLLAGTLRYPDVSLHLPLGLRTLIVVMGLLWLALQFYVWPLLFEQPQKRLRNALLSALLLTFAAPVYTFTIWLMVGAVTLIASYLFPAGLWLVSFLTLLGNTAVIDRLAAYGRDPDPGSAARFQK